MSTQLSPVSNATPTQLANTANEAAKGNTNNTGTLTIPAGQASLVVVDSRMGISKVVHLCPMDANGSYWWISGRQSGQFTVNLVTAPSADAVYGYAIVGS